MGKQLDSRQKPDKIKRRRISLFCIERRRKMSKRKYMVRAECPQCACGDVSFLGPEKLREKFIGDEKEIEILCPFCGTKHKGKLQEEIVEED
jgi:hypothetical protein